MRKCTLRTVQLHWCPLPTTHYPLPTTHTFSVQHCSTPESYMIMVVELLIISLTVMVMIEIKEYNYKGKYFVLCLSIRNYTVGWANWKEAAITRAHFLSSTRLKIKQSFAIKLYSCVAKNFKSLKIMKHDHNLKIVGSSFNTILYSTFYCTYTGGQ